MSLGTAIFVMLIPVAIFAILVFFVFPCIEFPKRKP